MSGFDGELDHNTIALSSGGKKGRLLKPGDIVGENYRLLGLIGRGGMGYVFAAEHMVFHQQYALKVLAPDQVNEITWNRFQSEGRAIAKLDHPNIVKIYNMGVDGEDCLFYVMDLLNGVSLADCIADEMNLSMAEILDMYIQIAQGFGYAHSRGIIHRDVKPGNIVMVDSGKAFATPKIVDFGIAKLTGQSDQVKQSLTATGEIFGSPYYMSPEQCLGNEIDHRADIYSLGCALFETINGKPPFRGESALATVLMHQNEPPPPLTGRDGQPVSDELEAIVCKMLAKKPAERYQSMEQLAHDLERVRANKAVGRGVETGFRSAADAHFEEMDAKFAEDRNRARTRSILVGVPLVLIGLFIAAVMMGAFKASTAPVPKSHTIASDIGYHIVPQSAEDNNFIVRDERAKNKTSTPAKTVEVSSEAAPPVTTNISTIKEITSEIIGKKRIFHCPEKDAGELYWFAGTRDVSGGDYEERDDVSVPAMGDVAVPADRPIYLLINRFKDNKVWNDPAILTRYGANELNGLIIHTFNGDDVLLSKAEEAVADKCIVNMVKAAAGWKKFQYMNFDRAHAPIEALQALEVHKDTLEELSLLETTCLAKDVANCSFLPKLKHFNAITMLNLDLIFERMRNSPALLSINIRGCPVSAKGLEALATCPNLTLLNMQIPDFGDDYIIAISKMKRLKGLKVSGVNITVDEIPLLKSWSFIDTVELDMKGLRKSDRNALYLAVPCIHKGNHEAMLRWEQAVQKRRREGIED